MIELINISIHLILIILLFHLPLEEVTGKTIQLSFRLSASAILILITYFIFCIFGINSNYVEIFTYITIILNIFYFFRKKKYNNLINVNFFFIITLAIIFSVLIAYNMKLGWDAQNIWINKYLVFDLGGNINNMDLSPRPEYPFYGTYLWFIFKEISFLNLEYFGRIFYVFLFLLSLTIISSLINSSEKNKSILFLLLVFLLYSESLFSGYQEVLVFSIISITITYFYTNPFKKQVYINLLIIYFVSLILICTKNDALIFIISFYLSYLFIFKKYRILILSTLLLSILTRILIFHFYNLEINIQTDNYDKIDIQNLFSYFSYERFLIISKHLLISLFKVPAFFIVFLCFILSFFYINSKFINFLRLNFIFNIIAVYSVYFLTNLPLEFHLGTSLSRIIFQMISIQIFFVPIFYEKLFRKIIS